MEGGSGAGVGLAWIGIGHVQQLLWGRGEEDGPARPSKPSRPTERLRHTQYQ